MTVENKEAYEGLYRQLLDQSNRERAENSKLRLRVRELETELAKAKVLINFLANKQ